MSIRLAINGYGRIGRCFFRALHESPLRERFTVAAINEPADLESIAYLTRFDSTHGRFPLPVSSTDSALIVDGQRIPVFHGTSAGDVPWRELGVDLLVECSGLYGDRRDLEAFLAAGCERLLLSNPAHDSHDVDATVVYGVNEGNLTGRERLVSAASCTTNASVPILSELDRCFGIKEVMLTTLHSVMNDQPQIDGYHHSDLRRTRSAMQSMVPVSTGLARGIERLLPQLTGRVQAKAIRVPVLNVSAIELSLTLDQPASVAGLNACLLAASERCPELIAYSDEPHASIDFNHSAHSAIVDGSQTRIAGQLASVLLWFDNEWGFANRMLDIAAYWRWNENKLPLARQLARI